MDPTADVDAFFGDFGTEVTTADNATFTALFDDTFAAVGEVAVESIAYSLTCRASDVSAAEIGHGTILGIEGNEYTVRGVEPDGPGVTVLRLERV